MSAIVIILPGNPVDPLADDKLHEQRIQEEIALIANRNGSPPRSRLTLVVEPPCTVWVELKRPGKGAEAHQAREHDVLRKVGQAVFVIDTKSKVDLHFHQP